MKEVRWEGRGIYRGGKEDADFDLPKRVLDFACFPQIIMNSATFPCASCPLLEGKLHATLVSKAHKRH